MPTPPMFGNHSGIDLDISGGPNLGKSQDWAEPIVGLRMLWKLSPRWGVTAAGDIGGFGVGSDFAASQYGERCRNRELAQRCNHWPSQ